MRTQTARQLLALSLLAFTGPLAGAEPLTTSPSAAASAALPPQAPGAPSGSFVVLTREAGPIPMVRLQWAPSEAGDFLIAGYRLFRATPGGAWEARAGAAAGSQPIAGAGVDDPAEVGQVYDYAVEAVDAKGSVGPRSPVGRVDLSQLPPQLLAPPAPLGLTATARRSDVALQWERGAPWVAPISGYRLWRADSAEALAAAQPLELSGTSYVDTPPAPGTPRWYAVSSVDLAGRISPMSATLSAQATGTQAPGAPPGLTTRARTEKVALAWEAAPVGTAPVSAYLLRRREESVETWESVARLDATKREYTDKAPGDRGYLYALEAVDTEGNTGPASYVGASPSAKALNKTLVVIMPTAYANHRGTDRGLNLNVLFDFYVGSLFESYTNPTTRQTKTGQFQPLQIATVTSDTKWALLDDRGLIPGIAAGMYISALINFGQPTGTQTVGISSTGGGIATLGNAYAVISKRFWPGEPRASIHGGLFYGGLADSIAQEPMPKDWRLTARHLLPGGDFPSLLSRFVDPKFGARVGQAPHMAFGGLQLPFTVPLLFTRWQSGLRLEYITPLAFNVEYAPSTLPPPAQDPATQLPWLLNVHIDNLPLFGFEIGYLQLPGGFQVIAFYHIPDLTWSW